MAARSARESRFRLQTISMVAAVAVLLLLSMSGAAAQSPATGHAEVIAQGVSPLPIGNAVWQVTGPDAKANDTQTAQRSLGFILARSATVLVTGANPDDQSLLDPGEARFVPEGSNDSRATISGKNALYWNIALVSATNAGIGEVVYQSEPFTPPAGRHDLNLVRDVLSAGESSSVSAAQAPILVLVTSGTVNISTTDGATKTLKAKSAQAFSDDITITATGSHTATFVAAVIGAQVGGNVTVTPVATTSGPATTTGSITITTYSCPSTTTYDTLDPSVCTSADQALWFLTRTADNTRIDADSAQGGVLTWSDLPFGDYLVSFPGNGGGVGWVLQGSNAINHQSDGTTTLTVSAAAPDVTVNAYEWVTASAPSGSISGTGSIQLDFFDCQPGMTVNNFDPSGCSPMPAGIGSFVITSPALTTIGPIVSISDAQSLGNGSFQWSNLPFGEYTVSPGNNYNGPALFAPDIDSAAPLSMAGFSLTLDGNSPAWDIAIYRLSTGVIPGTPGLGG